MSNRPIQLLAVLVGIGAALLLTQSERLWWAGDDVGVSTPLPESTAAPAEPSALPQDPPAAVGPGAGVAQARLTWQMARDQVLALEMQLEALDVTAEQMEEDYAQRIFDDDSPDVADEMISRYDELTERYELIEARLSEAFEAEAMAADALETAGGSPDEW